MARVKQYEKQEITITIETTDAKVVKAFSVYDLKKLLASDIIEKSAGQMSSDLLETIADV